MNFGNTMIGCVLSVVCSCLIGAVWYSPSLPFGRLWMHRTFPGKSAKDVRQQGKMALGFTVVSSVFLSLLLRFILIDFFRLKIVNDAIAFSLGLASLTAFLEFPHAVFSQKPFDVYVIDQLYNFAVMGAAGVCIFYFP